MPSDKAEEDTFVESGEGIRNKFSINAGLSGLLLDGMLECGQMDVAAKNMFDNDNQFIPTEKYDSKYSYKKPFGYFLGIAQMDEFPFYIDGRDSNSTSNSGRPTRCDAPSWRWGSGTIASAGFGWIAAHMPRRLSTSPVDTATSSTSGSGITAPCPDSSTPSLG